MRHSKCRVRQGPWVRIPLSPPVLKAIPIWVSPLKFGGIEMRGFEAKGRDCKARQPSELSSKERFKATECGAAERQIAEQYA